MDPVLRPTILIFDLDGTTHDILETCADGRNRKALTLSQSAENLTSPLHDKKGICIWYVSHERGGPITHKMQAIARLKFKEILDKAYNLHWLYGERSPLAIKIITKGDYKKHEIMKCWDKFYDDDDDQRFSRGNFPVEFFNCSSFRKDGKPIPEDAPDSEFDKGKLMNEMFPLWQKQMPGLTKERVFIVDDDKENDKNVQENGFPPAIKFPTTVSTRKAGDTFTEFGPLAFKALHRIIDEASGVTNQSLEPMMVDS